MALIDPWAEFRGGAAPAGPPPPRGPVTLGTPRPRTPPAQTPEQARADVLQNRQRELDIQEDTRRAELRGQALEGSQLHARSVIDAVADARRNLSGWSTGIPGAVLRNVPGTQARDLEASISTVIANIGFDRLQEMRNASPTGGALGQVSDFENRMLQASLTNLELSQSREQFERNLDQAEFHYLNVLNTMQGRQPFRTLEEARRAHGGGDGEEQQGTQANEAVGRDRDEAAPGATPPAPDNIDPTTQSVASPGSGTAQASTEVRTVTDEALARIAPRLGVMISRGRPVNEILDYARQNGVDPAVIQGSLARIAAQRSNPNSNVARWIRANPNRPYPVQSTYEVPLTAAESRDAATAASPLGSAVIGAGDVGSLGTLDEISAAAEAIGGGDRDLDDFRQAMRVSAETNPGSYLAGQVAGGFALPFSRTNQLGRLALESGGFGAGYGFGSGEDLEGRFTNMLAGGVAGAVTPPAIEGVFRSARALRRRPAQAATGPAPQDIAAALEAEGIPAARPVADPSRRGRMAYLETTRGGHDIVTEGLEKTRAGIERRAGELRGPGNVQTPGGMGETIRGATNRRLDVEGERARQLYTQADRAAGGATIRPEAVVAMLDGQIAELSQNPNTNRALIDYLNTVRADFVDEGGNLVPKTVGAIRDIRTNLSAEINSRNLGRSNAERLVGAALDAAKDDITRDLGATAPDALRLYNQADRIWRARAQARRQIVERLTGPADNPLSGEQVMGRVRAMMGNRGDLSRFRRVMDTLTPEERADFRATLAEPLGRRSADEPFSPATLIANTRDMQPEALRQVFGADGAQSIQNLRLAARGFTDTSSALNRSRSGFVANFKDVVSSITNLRSAGLGAAGYAVAGWPGALVGAAAGEGIQRVTNNLSARALMNTDVSRWIHRVSQARTDSAVRTSIDELRTIAERNPALVPEITGLRQFLLQAANDNFAPGRIAASPDDGEAQQPQPERRAPQPSPGYR